MALSHRRQGAADKLGAVVPELTLNLDDNLRKVTGFDQRMLLAAITEDRVDQSFGILTLWGWDLIWKIEGIPPTLTVQLAADW